MFIDIDRDAVTPLNKAVHLLITKFKCDWYHIKTYIYNYIRIYTLYALQFEQNPSKRVLGVRIGRTFTSRAGDPLRWLSQRLKIQLGWIIILCSDNHKLRYWILNGINSIDLNTTRWINLKRISCDCDLVPEQEE